MPSVPTSCGGLPSFFKAELQRALSEQTFGIVNYSLGMSTAYDATATVALLEKVQLDMTLTARGFRVTRTSAQSNAGTDVDFETIEALLQRHSPLYEVKRMELLLQKLGP